MTESSFSFIPQVFFVADLPNGRLKRAQKSESASRSHAARIAHEKRKAAKECKRNLDETERIAESKQQVADILRNAKFAEVPTSIKIFWKLVVPGVTPMYTLFNTRVTTSDEWIPYMAQDVLITVCFLALLERRFNEMEANWSRLGEVLMCCRRI
ncbi:hypothetical protein BJX70DRAFT_363579 [Aspergillus crustosus]